MQKLSDVFQTDRKEQNSTEHSTAVPYSNSTRPSDQQHSDTDSLLRRKATVIHLLLNKFFSYVLQYTVGRNPEGPLLPSTSPHHHTLYLSSLPLLSFHIPNLSLSIYSCYTLSIHTNQLYAGIFSFSHAICPPPPCWFDYPSNNR